MTLYKLCCGVRRPGYHGARWDEAARFAVSAVLLWVDVQLVDAVVEFADGG